MRKKAGGQEKEVGGGTRRGSSRAASQRQSRSHSDDEEEEGIPASYHTVSLQVSQDVSTTALFYLLLILNPVPFFLTTNPFFSSTHCHSGGLMSSECASAMFLIFFCLLVLVHCTSVRYSHICLFQLSVVNPIS